MKVGIVGFPGSGKTTVFNALTGLSSETGSHTDPSRPRLGTIKVPDERVDRLSEIFQPRRTTHAEVIFVDFPRGADAGSGTIDRGTLARMRDVDALVQVVRAFRDPLTGAEPNPVADVRAFHEELVLADLAIVEKRSERLRKENARGPEADAVARCRAALEAERALRTEGLSEAELKAVSGLGLLSRLPMLVVLNVEERDVARQAPAEVERYAGSIGAGVMTLSAPIEAEIAALAPEDRPAFLEDLGLAAPAAHRFVQECYALLDLISFLTTGADEVRAWPIRRGTTAVRAAGRVHSDIERGFICAAVVSYEDFIACGASEARCREAGKLRLEGKNYVVQDGDIIHFRFNV